MKPKPEFDPDLAAPSRPRRPLARICGLLLLLAVVSVLALRSSRPARARQTIAPGVAPLLAANGLLILQPAPGAPIRLYRTPQDDRLVMMASPAIDPNMVHPAPKGIDEAMVIALSTSRRRLLRGSRHPPLYLASQGCFRGSPTLGFQTHRPRRRRSAYQAAVTRQHVVVAWVRSTSCAPARL